MTDRAPSRGAGTLGCAIRFNNVQRGETVVARRCSRCRHETPDSDLWVLLPHVELACGACKDAWLDAGGRPEDTRGRPDR